MLSLPLEKWVWQDVDMHTFCKLCVQWTFINTCHDGCGVLLGRETRHSDHCSFFKWSAPCLTTASTLTHIA